MVYDCFCFYNELDLLEIRLNILNGCVDKFVLVEATRTQRNNPKPLYFAENKERYKKFEDKIIHLVLDEYPEHIEQWTIENLQRNYIMKGLEQCSDDDIILISDLDEIPRPEFVRKYYEKDKITAFDMDAFSFYLNLFSRRIEWTRGTKMLSYKSLKGILDNEYFEKWGLSAKDNSGTTPTKVRMYDGPLQQHIPSAGWHFLYGRKRNGKNKICFHL